MVDVDTRRRAEGLINWLEVIAYYRNDKGALVSALDALLDQRVADAVAQAVKELRESLEPGTPERIFIGLMDECAQRGIGSRYSFRHVVSQVMKHVDQQAEEIARLRAIKERAEHELYIAGCVDDGINPTMRLMWRVLGLGNGKETTQHE